MNTWPEGVAKRIVAKVDSTNAEAARIANDLTGPTWILAHQQTSGRGRRGRGWHSQAGNFTATLVQRPSEAPDRVALRSFVAALALRDALVSLTGRDNSFSLKWPNDVLMNGGKLAGILLESAGEHKTLSFLAVGIGVNLKSAPEAADLEASAVTPVSLLGETGIKVTPEAFLDALAPVYDRWERQLVDYGFGPIRTAWLRYAARLGDVTTARTMKSEVTGTFETVDDTGALVLKAADGRHRIPAADILFP